MQIYLSKSEATALLRGVVLPSVTAKVESKLEPDQPIEGQTTIYEQLEAAC
jgi:hypothetical protein